MNTRFENPAAGCACFNLRKAARAVTQLYDRFLQPSGLRATQFTILAALDQTGPRKLSALADALVLDRTTLTRNLKPLQRDNLIESRAGDDRRVRELTITQIGKIRLDEALPLWREAQEDMKSRIGAKTASALLDILQKTVTATT
ncbi:MAG: MarR family winged helix-turn-helix transcriptional regulator [Proteobacteria bacterium]|nr:MarR family winged helix-turn-helix transcriptional regulator [Pseudomonadota bacterium]